MAEEKRPRVLPLFEERLLRPDVERPAPLPELSIEEQVVADYRTAVRGDDADEIALADDLRVNALDRGFIDLQRTIYVTGIRAGVLQEKLVPLVPSRPLAPRIRMGPDAALAGMPSTSIPSLTG